MHNEKPLGDRKNYEPGPEKEWLSLTLQQLKGGLDTRSSAIRQQASAARNVSKSSSCTQLRGGKHSW